jgi:hypothetical protein
MTTNLGYHYNLIKFNIDHKEVFNYKVVNGHYEFIINVEQNNDKQFIIQLMNIETNSKLTVIRDDKWITLFYNNPISQLLVELEYKEKGTELYNKNGWINCVRYLYDCISTSADYPRGYKKTYDKIHNPKIQKQANKVIGLSQEQATRLDVGLLVEAKNYNELIRNITKLMQELENLDK